MHYPTHVALIPDGNRTWAKEKNLDSLQGHLEGLQRGIELITYVFSHTPIKVFTSWGLSTENRAKRSQQELEYLFKLYEKIGNELDSLMEKQQINYKWIGSAEWLPDHLVSYLRHQEKRHTYPKSEKYSVTAINYGGRDEIVRAVQKIIKKNIQAKDVTQELISQHSDLAWLPPVDLVIRTKWDMAQRTSWFLSWRIGYAELYFSKLKCPDFTVEKFEEALQWFDTISAYRNFWK